MWSTGSSPSPQLPPGSATDSPFLTFEPFQQSAITKHQTNQNEIDPMKYIALSIISATTLIGMPFAFAEAKEKCEKTCEVAKKSDCQACPVAAAMEALPKISYVIAGEASACAKSAATAKAAGKEVKYVVADKELCCDKMAKDAHVDAVEKFVGRFASAQSCETSGKTYVGTNGYACGQHANTVAAVAKKAMDSVSVKHIVAGKEYCCPEEAGKAAKEAGAKVTYAVADEKTECAKTSRMTVAVAKYKAAIQAIAKAEAETAESAPAKS